MKGKNVLIISIIVNIALIALMLFVKAETTEQAKVKLSKFNETFNNFIYSVDEIRYKNDALWKLSINAYDTDKSFKAIKELASKTNFPGIKKAGKNAEEPSPIPMTISEVKADNATNLKVGWEKYSIVFEFDKNAKLIKVNTTELMNAKDAITQNKDTRDWSLVE